MKTNGEEHRNISDAQISESKERQLAILSQWIMTNCEEVGGVLVESEVDDDIRIEMPLSPESEQQVKRIAGMVSVYDEILADALDLRNSSDDESDKDHARTDNPVNGVTDSDQTRPSSDDSDTDSESVDKVLNPLSGENSERKSDTEDLYE
jgi:hypothetical protein